MIGEPQARQLAARQHVRPLTPKEFSAAIGGLRSEKWVRAQCRAGRLAIIEGTTRPYLIQPDELCRFRRPLEALTV